MYQKSQETRRNLREAEHELVTLEARKADLQRDLTYIKSESGFDQEIRDKFGVAKKDETMIVIVRDEPAEVVAQPTPKPTFWARFKGWFGLE
jgi:DNA repair exonuclease SbcCD ATPase subunit